MVSSFPVHNWCPYCGRPLAQNTLFCPYCGYQLGTYLGVAVTPAPPPMWTSDGTLPPPYRPGRFPQPPRPFNQPSMVGMVSAPSAWDGRVHVLVDAYGRRWDGHQWVPNTQDDDKDAVADTPRPAAKTSKFWAAVALASGLFIILVFLFIWQVSPPNTSSTNGGNNPGGNGNDSSATYYLHFNCGGDASCIQTPGNGGNTGIFTTFSNSGDNQAACDQGRIPFDNLGEAQTSWCSTSSNPGDTGP